MTQQDQQRPLRVAFHTLGCRLNQFDTEGIKTALRHTRPVEVVGWQDEADLYLLNSCTVTGKADQECRRLARQVKRRHPDSRVVVAGCYAQTQPTDLQAVPEIDAVLGNTTKDDVMSWLPRVLAGTGEALVLVEDFPEDLVFDAPVIEEFDGRSRAFVKVQDGCDLRCSYCIIWQARGPARSCAPAEVLRQIDHLHREGGYNELILTGVDLGRWGKDLPEKPRLVDLVAAVSDAQPDLRLRLSSIHPNMVTDELLALMAGRPQLRPHLHISLQSGSDTVLKRMRRPYGRKHALDALQRAAAVAPDFGLGADVIVGFPGETDQEFGETLSMVRDHPFTYLHVFRYSPRPGTEAASMAAVHPETVSERSQILRDLAAAKQRAFKERLVGQRREAVIEDRDERQPGRHLATTDNYASLTVDTDLPAGTLVDVSILSLEGEQLTARVDRVLRKATP